MKKNYLEKLIIESDTNQIPCNSQVDLTMLTRIRVKIVIHVGPASIVKPTPS